MNDIPQGMRLRARPPGFVLHYAAAGNKLQIPFFLRGRKKDKSTKMGFSACTLHARSESAHFTPAALEHRLGQLKGLHMRFISDLLCARHDLKAKLELDHRLL